MTEMIIIESKDTGVCTFDHRVTETADYYIAGVQQDLHLCETCFDKLQALEKPAKVRKVFIVEDRYIKEASSGVIALSSASFLPDEFLQALADKLNSLEDE